MSIGLGFGAGSLAGLAESIRLKHVLVRVEAYQLPHVRGILGGMAGAWGLGRRRLALLIGTHRFEASVTQPAQAAIGRTGCASVGVVEIAPSPRVASEGLTIRDRYTRPLH